MGLTGGARSGNKAADKELQNHPSTVYVTQVLTGLCQHEVIQTDLEVYTHQESETETARLKEG